LICECAYDDVGTIAAFQNVVAIEANQGIVADARHDLVIESRAREDKVIQGERAKRIGVRAADNGVDQLSIRLAGFKHLIRHAL
jgi:hypothetical protein